LKDRPALNGLRKTLVPVQKWAGTGAFFFAREFANRGCRARQALALSLLPA
jgi:hypothetical protein